MKTANELAKVIANLQSDWLKQRRSQWKLIDFFLKQFELCNNRESVLSYNTENGFRNISQAFLFITRK